MQFLEDPKYPSLSPHLFILGFIGLWHPTCLKSTKFKQILFYIITFFFTSQYVKCLKKLDFDSLKLILQYAPFHMGIVKACFFQKDHTLWEELVDYISKTESTQLIKENGIIHGIIAEYIRRNRKITYFFWALAFFSNFSIFTEPYQKNQIVENGTSIYLHIFDGFTPFEAEPPGYYISMAIQTVLGNVVSVYVVGWDTLVVSIMIFYAGQLKIAHNKCVYLIDIVSVEQCHENIAEFHRFYIGLIRYQKLFNDLISRVMFVYLIVISVNLGVCIIQIVELQDDKTALVSSILYIVACLIQLLLFYWHANEVTIESLKMHYAVFESDWIQVIADTRLMKEVALLGLTTTKRLAFEAGPFNEMSLSTFVGILRTSYSFYTLMNGTK